MNAGRKWSDGRRSTCCIVSFDGFFGALIPSALTVGPSKDFNGSSKFDHNYNKKIRLTKTKVAIFKMHSLIRFCRLSPV